MKMKSKSVYIRLTQKDIALIDIEATRHGVTRSAIARHAIRAWLRAVARRRAEGGTRTAESKTRAQPGGRQ